MQHPPSCRGRSPGRSGAPPCSWRRSSSSPRHAAGVGAAAPAMPPRWAMSRRVPRAGAVGVAGAAVPDRPSPGSGGSGRSGRTRPTRGSPTRKARACSPAGRPRSSACSIPASTSRTSSSRVRQSRKNASTVQMNENGKRFSHGTAVASVIAGARPSNVADRAHGVAWGARLAVFAIPLGTPSDAPYNPASLTRLASNDTGDAAVAAVRARLANHRRRADRLPESELRLLGAHRRLHRDGAHHQLRHHHRRAEAVGQSRATTSTRPSSSGPRATPTGTPARSDRTKRTA